LQGGEEEESGVFKGGREGITECESQGWKDECHGIRAKGINTKTEGTIPKKGAY